MKARVILTILFVLVTAAAASGQEDPPPAATDFIPERWKEFTSSDRSFSVLLPGVPTEASQPVNTKPDSPVLHYYALTTVAAEYSVGYTVFGRDVENPKTSKMMFDGIRDRTLAKESGKLISEQDISAADHPGRAITMEVSDGIFRDRYFLVGNRLYTLSIFTRKVKAQTEEFTAGIRKSQESIANRFLDSFRLLGK
jgi:hypothetical protein